MVGCERSAQRLLGLVSIVEQFRQGLRLGSAYAAFVFAIVLFVAPDVAVATVEHGMQQEKVSRFDMLLLSRSGR